MKEHQKHKKIAQPNLGQWGRNEYAIIGTTCAKIKELAVQITERVAGKFKVCYIDASHKEEIEILDFDSTFLGKVNSFQFEQAGELNKYQRKIFFQDYDLILVNGNHFTADQQIVVIDSIKKESLRKKLPRLTNVKMVLLEEDMNEPYPFLKDYINNSSLLCKVSEPFVTHLLEDLESQISMVNGLVLTGGKSSRMGKDKALLDYHGKPQKLHIAELMETFCDAVYFSESHENKTNVIEKNNNEFPIIYDKFYDLGPMGGLLSAFQENPNTAWLTIACDLPMIDQEAIEHLMNHRNPAKIATCFIKKDNPFPDPLFTIWEPKSYPVLLQFLALGYSCPRKVLINSNVEVIEIPNEDWLINANDVEAYEAVLAKLNGSI